MLPVMRKMMMVNSSQVLYFILGDYADIGVFRYVVFVLMLCLYVCITAANVLLLVVICVNRSLHEPMYMFVCSLFVNELYGSTGLFPFLLIQILSDLHTVPAALCFLQIFCLYTYVNIEFYNLAVMSYDRYLAICHPLMYSSRMSLSRAGRLVVLAWSLPVAAIAVMIALSASLRFCGNVIDRVYCNNYFLVRLACSEPTLNNTSGLVYTFTVLVGLALLILYTYARILRVCCSGSRQTRQKALGTCTPHLASLLNFCFGCFFEILQSRQELNGVPSMVRTFLSVYFIIVQPLFNPLLYGLSLRKVRLVCRTLLSHRKLF